MTKNPILNDLIGLCIFIPVILLMHAIDPSDGLGLWSSLAFVPLFVGALDVMVRFQFMAIDKPKLSFEWIMNAVSWAVLQASVMTINMADFPDRAAVLLQFAIQFTIMTSVWWFLGQLGIVKINTLPNKPVLPPVRNSIHTATDIHSDVPKFLALLE